MALQAIQAVVFDWAGTMVDFGSLAPMGAFVEVFGRFGVEITIEEARRPMGLPKLDHIRALGAEPRIAEAWSRANGTPFDEAAARAIYEVFVPLNAEVVADYADLVPGAARLVAALRRDGVRIGSTTGYTRDIMERLLPKAAEQGYAPDNLVCAGDLAAGRPTPLMMYKCFVDLGVWQPERVVKVDDTEPGLAEGLAAGTWTVGVSLSGNAVGLSPAELAAAEPAEVARLDGAARERLFAAGAHAVVDSVADLLPLLGRLDVLIRGGARPHRL
ncbi:phosphonoacetaldehyde hydrolase [Tistlia consotensis]|uniref:Phosphonoacetaldehyde hydrolase n=1 Tax=Tistlia consotensis USBA 355 TaxID=560819 RepID=A0A1Y6C1H5_9PROT|nr:phosphonoacetaldehyde hydrolase [Tistlia consotensis]SMF38747.1 phosphonoacetaldehyde hydrolase [Tistlia consotensis USBA 355]SNR36879.1 phosphonoacetaldehyde hydrolase [Tistlia consotensis]